MRYKYDIIVLGGGAGGLTVAAGAASIGAKVALIEKEEQPGGDCLHYGCVPSKAFIKAANEMYHMRQAVKKYGMNLEGHVNMSVVKEKVRRAIDTIRAHDDADRFRQMGVDVYMGKGVFKSKHEIEVEDGTIVSGKRIVIATGSRPFIPQIEGLNETGFLTNETVFDIDSLPSSLFVIGGGPIGLELAQAMSRLGCNVTVVERSPFVLNKEDEDVKKYATKKLQEELTILTNATVNNVSKRMNKKLVTIICNGEQKHVEVDEILVASGRRPNSGSIGLHQVGVQTDSRGFIQVNDYLQTNIPSIYAIGDVNGTFMFTHVAGLEGKSIVQNAVLGLKQKVNYDNIPWVTFTSPEIFHLGLTEEEARKQYREINVYKANLSDVDRFVADHQTEGFVKIITNQKGHIVGAHAIGDGAGDWMQLVVYAKQKGHKVGDLSRMVYPYPNHAAAIQRTTDLYWREKLFNGWIPSLLRKYIRWFR